ncbi:MAG: hypothetical protein R3B96_02290 [Pirellulaceae bacterium]
MNWSRTWSGPLLVWLFLASPLLACCLWDYDTLQQERQRFPTALELITGQFLRHSQPFYEWRVADRQRRLEQTPNDVALLDDLAVAYEKLGQHDRAIEVMKRKESIAPGLYETRANLGTFLIHAGRYDEGLAEIRRAIEINPDAHFGRELYQQLLVEYAMSRRVDDVLAMPLATVAARESIWGPQGFASFVLDQRRIDREDQEAVEAELDAALKGVLGMQRFGNHDSPVLLEALGDLLMAKGPSSDAKRLAARAFLRASYETEGDAAAAYRALAQESLSMQTIHPRTQDELRLPELEREFRKELQAAERWYRELEQNERRWIERGLDPEAEYDKLYREDPTVGLAPIEGSTPGRRRGLSPIVTSVLGAAFVFAWIGFRWRRSRRASAVS